MGIESIVNTLQASRNVWSINLIIRVEKIVNRRFLEVSWPSLLVLIKIIVIQLEVSSNEKKKKNFCDIDKGERKNKINKNRIILNMDEKKLFSLLLWRNI